jgi:hypothetical protein
MSQALSAEVETTFDAKAWRDKRRTALRAKNICVDCGVEPMSVGHTLCEECLADRRRREKRGRLCKADENRKRRKELLWKGLAQEVPACETGQHGSEENGGGADMVRRREAATGELLNSPT